MKRRDFLLGASAVALAAGVAPFTANASGGWIHSVVEKHLLRTDGIGDGQPTWGELHYSLPSHFTRYSGYDTLIVDKKDIFA